MKILITGNQGYVGPVVARHLRAAHPTASIIGYDTGYYATALTGTPVSPEQALNAQWYGDIREIGNELLREIDAVIHLAAVSNDPMGKRFEKATDEVNCGATITLASKARDAGVKRFVFASSCSIYGFATGSARKESDELNPQTAYARSKVMAEQGLAKMDLGRMLVTNLRFATACGMSPRLRLDLVLNDFVATAMIQKEVKVLSDGMPWRPLIDVSDMARAVEWAATRDAANGGTFLSVNVGEQTANYQVIALARAVQSAFRDVGLSINPNATPDNRSYQVDFSLYKSLAPDFLPIKSLSQTIEDLKAGLEEVQSCNSRFNQSAFMRLKTLERHIEADRIDLNLHWKAKSTQKQK